MPSGPKKRRASRRKQAEAMEHVSSTAGVTESCCIGLMETDVAEEVSNDAQQVEEHVAVHLCGTCISEVAVENEIGSKETDIAAEVSNVAVYLFQQEHAIDVVPSTESPTLKKLYNVVRVDQQVEEHGLQSEVAVENELGSMETDTAVHLFQQEHAIDVVTSTESPALKKLYNVVQVDQQVEGHGLQSEVAVENEFGSMETDTAVHLFQQEHAIDVVISTESPALQKLYNVVQVDQQVEEHGFQSEVAVKNEIGSMETDIAGHLFKQENVIDVVPSTESPALKKLYNGLQSEVMGLVDGEDGNVAKEIDSTKSNEGVHAVPELELAVESDDVVVGDAQFASKKVNKDFESFTRLNGGCVSVEQADNSQDVGLNVMELSQENQEDVFDAMPLKKLNDAVKLSQQVESVVMDNVNDGNMPNENGLSNGGFSVPVIEELTGENAIKLASKKDEKHGESVGDDSAFTRNFAKLLHLVEQIELLVQEVKGLIIAQQKEQIKFDE